MAFFTEDFLNFFIELAPNNHKDWFDLNRKRCEESIKKPFYAFTQHLIDRITKSDAAFKDLLAKDCVFRINRDIRFSKDKSPYKLQYSAVIAPRKLTPMRLALINSARVRLALLKSALVRFALAKKASTKSASLRLTPERLALLKSA